jgi:DNA-binding IclR family transcriptional regulator
LKDLSHQVGPAHSTVSEIVDRLEKQGLLERKTHAAMGIAASKAVRDFLRDTLSRSDHPPAKSVDGPK